MATLIAMIERLHSPRWLVPRWQFHLYLFLVVLLIPTATSAAEQLVPLHHGRVSFAAAGQLYGATQPVALPHQWSFDPEGFYGTAIYRFPVMVHAPQKQSWCVLIGRLTMNARVSINNILLGDGGSMDMPLSRNWHRPLRFCFPGVLMHEGANEVEIEVRAYANRFGMLSTLWLGPRDQVMPVYDRLFLGDQQIYAVTTIISLALALLIGYLWWLRSEPQWFWFSAASFFWGIQSLNALITDPPVATQLWEWLCNISVGLIPISLFLFLLRLQGRYLPLVEKLLALLVALFAGLLLLVPLEWFFTVADYWHGLALLIGGGALWQAASAFFRGDQDRTFLIIMIGMALMLVCGLHDLLAHLDWGVPADSGYWLNFAVPGFFLMIGLLLVWQFTAAVRHSEELNRTLEGRVKQAESEIADNYRRIATLQTAQAVASERSRILRDLHDDLGGKLLMMVYRATSDDLRQLARTTLETMRDLVRAGQSSAVDLAELLADKRCRLAEQCEAASITLIWQVEGDLERNCERQISGEQALHLKRILSEAVTNAIRHSGGNRIDVLIRLEDETFWFCVRDNGCGIADVPVSDGSGMQNMRARARRLGASVAWQRGAEGGCEVVFNWHMEPPLLPPPGSRE